MIISTVLFTVAMFWGGAELHQSFVDAVADCDLIRTEKRFIKWEYEVGIYSCPDGSDIEGPLK